MCRFVGVVGQEVFLFLFLQAYVASVRLSVAQAQEHCQLIDNDLTRIVR